MSAVDVLADLAGVGRPDGDPALLRDAAVRLAADADGFDRVAVGLSRLDGQVHASWTGQAAAVFSVSLALVRRKATTTAGVLREAAGAINVYSVSLDGAQQRWARARDGAILGRASSLIDPFHPSLRAAVAEAEQADEDARAAARRLAGELASLAARAMPLPDATPALQYQDRRSGGWLTNWVDKAWDDPLGAAADWGKQYAAGIVDAVKGYWDLGVMVAKAHPAYLSHDPAGAVENGLVAHDMLVGMAAGMAALNSSNPAVRFEAQKRFVSSLLNLDTLATGNIPRWQGSFVPDAIIAAATAGSGAAASASVRGGTTAVRTAGAEAKTASLAARLASSEARLARIAELAERNAARQLQRLDASPDAHPYARHGPQTTIEQQYQRAVTGRTPDGLLLNPRDSSRFLSHREMLSIVQRAQTIRAQTGNPRPRFDMGSIIGEGFTANGGEWRMTSWVRAVFDPDGNLITIYPWLRPS